MTGEQVPAKQARCGPCIIEEGYNSLAGHVQKTKDVRQQLQDEMGIALTMEEACEAICPLGDTEWIELNEKMSDIQYRIGGGVAATTEKALTIAIAVADASHVDPGHGVATPRLSRVGAWGFRGLWVSGSAILLVRWGRG